MRCAASLDFRGVGGARGLGFFYTFLGAGRFHFAVTYHLSCFFGI